MAHALVSITVFLKSERTRVARVLTGPRAAARWVRPSLLTLLTTSAALYLWIFVSTVLAFSH